jgi:hypothetical protein
MRFETGRMLYYLMIKRVPAQVLHLHDHRFSHLIAGYFTNPDFPVLFHFLFLAELPLADYRVYPRNPLPDPRQLAVIHQLFGCQLESQVKQFLMSFLQFFLQFSVAKRFYLS